MLLFSVIIWTVGLVVVDAGPAISATSKNSPREGKAIGVPFAYEAETPQKVKTGCQGFKYGNDGDMDISYYFVDASGQKKFIPTGGSTKVAFPGPAVFPGAVRSANVYFHEFCFPVECHSTSCGQIVGPVIEVKPPPIAVVEIAPAPPATPTLPPVPPPTTTAVPTLPPPPKPCATSPPAASPTKPPVPPPCPTLAPPPACQPPPSGCQSPPPPPCAAALPQVLLNAPTPMYVLLPPPPPMYILLPAPPPTCNVPSQPPKPICSSPAPPKESNSD